MVNRKALGILYCVIFLKRRRLLANFSKVSSELIFVSLKFIKKKFVVGSFVWILYSFKTENIFFDHKVLCSIAFLVHSLSFMASILEQRAALAAGVEAIKDDEWIKRVIEHNTSWSKRIFSVLKEYKIKTNEPTANFFLMNFGEAKIDSEEAFEKLASKRLILRKMTQYKIPNSLRLTVGSKKANELFIKSFRSLFN